MAARVVRLFPWVAHLLFWMARHGVWPFRAGILFGGEMVLFTKRSMFSLTKEEHSHGK